ncbi:hypothetical protein [Thalassovita mangrovi]|uniref:Uncharacterized protein n=1 Tax=Thalassovita mangrovi TaxID=2692236 RepID=A0A6L8LIU4_9RHOB|nr:hypothetical protein [Thalassovita mangrovi]MYM55938.1 hypothetical protein [Thalassovita mangrovi]
MTIRTVSFAALAAAIIGLAPAAQAEMAVSPKQPASKIVKTHAGKGAARFDWMAKQGLNKQTRIQRVVLHGRGSWICSPAGFGKKSSCYSR